MNKALIFLVLSVICIGLNSLSAQPANTANGSGSNSTAAGSTGANGSGTSTGTGANASGSASNGTGSNGTSAAGTGQVSATGVGSSAAGTSERTPPAGFPTTQQMGQMLDQKQYADVIKDTQRIMQVKTALAEYDKADLDMLRGEAQLGLKQQGPAVSSFNLAAHDATDPTKAGYAKGMVTLIQQSKAFLYTPKANPNDPTRQTNPIDIIDPVTRKQALAALFVDEWTPAQTKIEQLKKQTTSLPPLLEAATLVGEMRGLEIAGTGSDTQTSKALGDLNESAAKLMNDYLDRNDKRVDQIETIANAATGDGRFDTQRRGLTGVQTSELKDIVATTNKLSLAAKQVAAASGDKGQDFGQIATKSDDLGKKALSVLNTDFSQSYNPNANAPIQTGVQHGGTNNHHY